MELFYLFFLMNADWATKQTVLDVDDYARDRYFQGNVRLDDIQSLITTKVSVVHVHVKYTAFPTTGDLLRSSIPPPTALPGIDPNPPVVVDRMCKFQLISASTFPSNQLKTLVSIFFL